MLPGSQKTGLRPKLGLEVMEAAEANGRLVLGLSGWRAMCSFGGRSVSPTCQWCPNATKDANLD